MKKDTDKLPYIIAIAIVILILAFISGMDLSGLRPASTVAPPTIQYVEFVERYNPDGYSGKYWVGTVLISGKGDTYRLIPHGLSYSDAITLELNGINTKWSRPIELDPSPLEYKIVKYHLWGIIPYESTGIIPYFDTSSESAKLASTALLTIKPPTSSQTIHTISNYGTDNVISVNIKDSDGIERTAYFKVQGIIIASGHLPPSGDLSLIEGDISGRYRLVTRTNLDGAVSAWNTFFDDNYLPAQAKYYDEYNEVYGWMIGTSPYFNTIWAGTIEPENRLPDRTKATTAIPGSMVVGTSEVSLLYPTSVFAPMVTYYIPEELAEYVVEVIEEPQFEFDTINKIDVNEGESYRLKVSGTAIGGGTILLSVVGDAIKYASWDDGAEKVIEKGRDYDFWVNIRVAEGFVADKIFIGKVTSKAVTGLGTSTSIEFEMYVTDSSTVESHRLTVKALEKGTNNIVTTAPIFVGAEQVGYGHIVKTIPEGTYTIFSENVTGWYSQYTSINPKTIDVDKDQTVIIEFTKEPPIKDEDEYTTLLIIGIIAIIIIILLSFIAREFGIDITPTHAIALIILVVLVIMGYIALDMTLGVIKEFTEAIKNFKLLG